MENGGDGASTNGTGDYDNGLNGSVKEHKSEHRSKEHKSEHKSKHKNKHKDKDRERSRDHKSSHKDKHRSKEHKSHKSSSRDKDRHSSSSKRDGDKDRHRDKDKHRDKNRDKDRHRDDKDKHRSKEVQMEIKEEPTDDFKVEESGEPMDTREPSPESPAASPEPEPEPAADDSQDFTDGDDEPRLVIKEEPPATLSDDDVPLSARKKPKAAKPDYESDEDVPLSARKKPKVKRKAPAYSDDEYDTKPQKKVKKEPVKRSVKTETLSPTKKKKKEEEEKEVWKWWEEEKADDGVKWRSLEHMGVLLAPPYEPLPHHVRFFYDGKEMRLSQDTEEIATFYAKMLDHDYTTKEVFNKNFFGDWRKAMTEKEREKITHLKKCDFTKMAAWFKEKTEERKNMSKEEKKALKEKNEAITAEYGFCMLDGHKERIGNFRAEPPGLFRGRGEHPKQGKVKRRIQPEDIIINIGKGAKIPEPPAGHKWKEVRHDNTVTWLASWTENIQGQIKYVMLNAASRLKGEKDWQKYETARRLNKSVDKIRESYRDDFKSKEMRIRQRAVAMYFIDKLALRAGNEKDDDQADTVGCCSLRVEHIKLEEELNGKQYVVVFDFLGKDSIRYYNEVSVEKRVFKNLQLFMENKEPGDDLFDRLSTTILNKHLNEQMEGLTAKVFRTFNASRTLQEQLDQLTEEDMTVNEKILAYNRANRAVAILCNHQRAVPKTFDKSMENLMKKIADKKETLEEAEKQYKAAKRASKNGGSVKERTAAEQKRKAVERVREQLNKLELSATDKEENKEIALGTSKLNYLDPRISVAWCKKWEVPIDKVYNKTQRDKFRWAIDMAGAEFVF